MGLVTTAALFKPDARSRPGAPTTLRPSFIGCTPETQDDDTLGISHVSYDRAYTTAEDINSYFPLQALRAANESGHIGSLSSRYYGLPTNRSQPTTMNQDCPDLLALLREDEVDLAILVAN